MHPTDTFTLPPLNLVEKASRVEQEELYVRLLHYFWSLSRCEYYTFASIARQRLEELEHKCAFSEHQIQYLCYRAQMALKK